MASSAIHSSLRVPQISHIQRTGNSSILRNGSCRFPTAAGTIQCLSIPTDGTATTSYLRIRCQGVANVVVDDGFYMRRCVELARKAVGCTSPNPMVGCVIVKDGVVVGEGFHPKAGQPHAEVFALRDAGNLAENATAYVSLEPCNHYGRTPPCTEALISAKVKRVVVGMVDPNPIVASKGVDRLRGLGIDVTVGVEEMMCQKLNEAYIHKMLTGKPFVTVRYLLSINGGVVDELGKGAEESGGYYSQLLQENDGVVISSNFLTRSKTLPASQETGAKQPVYIIIASSKDSPFHLPNLSLEPGTRAIVFMEQNTVLDPETGSNLQQQGIEVVVLDQIKLSLVLDYCSRLGMCSVLFDLHNDAGIPDTLIQEGLLQKVIIAVSPLLSTAESSVMGFGGKSPRLKEMHSRVVGNNILVEGYLS